MDSRTVPTYDPSHIPDYLIYDEMKRRRERDAWQPDYLELPLYRPDTPPPAKNPNERYDEPGERGEHSIPRERDDDEQQPPSDRGVLIIDMNDWGEDEGPGDED